MFFGVFLNQEANNIFKLGLFSNYNKRTSSQQKNSNNDKRAAAAQNS